MKFLYTIKFLILLEFTIVKSCKISKYYLSNQLVCHSFELKKEFFQNISKMGQFYFKFKKYEILDQRIINFTLYLKSLGIKSQKYCFRNLIGVDIDLFREMSKISSVYLSFTIYYSKIEFFNRTLKADKCKKIIPTFNFSLNLDSLLFLEGNKFPNKICPHYFENLNIDGFYLKFLAHSFNYKSIFSFFKVNNSINIKINLFGINYCENQDINDDIINLQVFKFTKIFIFFGKIKSIQTNLFKNFVWTKYIAIDIQFASQLFKKNFEWIENLNKDLKLDPVSYNNFTNRIIHVNIVNRFGLDYYYELDINHLFPEEDFCVYQNFPFQKMVLLSIFDNAPENPKKQYTCSFLWIAQNYSFFLNHSSKIEKGYTFKKNFKTFFSNNTDFSFCNFEQKLARCDLKTEKRQLFFDLFDFKVLIILLDYITLIYLIPFTSIICLVMNLTTIFIFWVNKNLKTLNHTQYKFIQIFSWLSLVYVLLEVVSLINECPFKNGFFCSNIIYFRLVQYYKIIINDYLIRILKASINFSLIGFSIFKLNIFARKDSKIYKKISNLSAIKLFAFIFASLSLICLPKLFIHQIVEDEPSYEYPSFLLDIYSPFIENTVLEKTLIYSNIISDFVTVFVLILFNFLIDILLGIKLKLILKKRNQIRRSKSDRKYIKLILISFTMIFLNILFRSGEIFQNLYFLLSYFNIFQNYQMLSKFHFFLREICLRLSLPIFINHLLEFSFLLTIILDYLFYFYNDQNYINCLSIQLIKTKFKLNYFNEILGRIKINYSK